MKKLLGIATITSIAGAIAGYIACLWQRDEREEPQEEEHIPPEEPTLVEPTKPPEGKDAEEEVETPSPKEGELPDPTVPPKVQGLNQVTEPKEKEEDKKPPPKKEEDKKPPESKESRPTPLPANKEARLLRLQEELGRVKDPQVKGEGLKAIARSFNLRSEPTDKQLRQFLEEWIREEMATTRSGWTNNDVLQALPHVLSDDLTTLQKVAQAYGVKTENRNFYTLREDLEKEVAKRPPADLAPHDATSALQSRRRHPTIVAPVKVEKGDDMAIFAKKLALGTLAAVVIIFALGFVYGAFVKADGNDIVNDNTTNNDAVQHPPQSGSAAASLFGGNADNWTVIDGSHNTGWIYNGPKRELTVPSGYRIDYPGNTCAIAGSSGDYGRTTVETHLATVWYVPGETSCPPLESSNPSHSDASSSQSSQGRSETDTQSSSSAQNSTPSGNNHQPGAYNNNRNPHDSVMTICGPVEWGPAGPAPGAFTDDSAAQVAEAVQVMRAHDSAQYVTVHKFCPGDDTPNGWIVGSSWTESQGIRVSADFLPAGVCVDYDHNVTTITGDIHHTEVQNPRWSRSQLKSDGSASGLKFTVYWTPCVFTDGTESWKGDGSKSSQSSTQQTTSRSMDTCPTSAQEVAERTSSSTSNWTQHPQYGNGWIYSGPQIAGFKVPEGGKVDYDGGSATSGTVPSGSAFTYWCPR